MILDSLLLVFPFILVVAAFLDLFAMKIPNKLNIALVIAYACFAYILKLPLEDVAMSLALSLGILAFGFGLFALGVMGGGDVKFMAAIALWFGFSIEALEFVFMTSIYGGLLTIAILLLRRVPYLPSFMHGQEWLLKLHDNKIGVPYGIAIAVAAIQIYPNTFWFKQLSAL